MQRRPLGRTRTLGVLPRGVLGCVLLLTTLTLSGPVRAAGTGGIEVTPIPSMRNGKALTTFTVTLPSRGTKTVPYTLRNLDNVPRSARVFAAQVSKSGGNYSLGTAGSSPYVLQDDRMVTLAPGAVLKKSFTVKAGTRPQGTVYAAVVVEVRRQFVVQRAATLITLRPPAGRPLAEVPHWLIVLAALLLLVVAVVLGRTVRSRTRPESTEGPHP